MAQAGSKPKMTISLVPCSLGGKVMLKMALAGCHTTWVGNSTSETPEMTSDTQITSGPLRWASKWWRKGRNEKQKEVGRPMKRNRTGNLSIVRNSLM